MDIGHFCWAELVGPDPENSLEFYTRLMDWSARSLSETYTEFLYDGEPVAGFYPSELQPAGWSCYVRVEDLQAVLVELQKAQGRVLCGPEPALGKGQVAWIEDPTGGRLGLWESSTFPGARLGSAGHLTACDLLASDAERAGAFYSRLFGWRFFARKGLAPNHFSFARGERRLGSMSQSGAPDRASCWTVSFAVDDVERSLARAIELGAQVNVALFQAPFGHVVGMIDPHGAVFGLVEPKPLVTR